jgi:5'-3' exonuclease
MGIPYYVASLIRQHKHLQKDCGNAPLEVDILGIDFNCFIHKYLNANNPIGSIVLALEDLLSRVVHAKKVYIAFDGLVPYAKMVQQRYRRMRKGETEQFDKHQISPGTDFMKELSRNVSFLFPNVIVSDTSEPGEGEHKIFLWARGLPAEERKSICIYGLDADLVLIAIAQSDLGNIVVLREKEDDGFATFSVTELMKVLPLDPETYVRMSVMCFGNDFMPTIAMFSLREDGYGRALHYANKNTAHKDEKKILVKRAKETDRHIVAPDGHALEARFGVQLMDGVLDWEPVVYAFWKTFAWTLHYFKTSEVLDWTWYYPYPEAPLLETLDQYPMTTEFQWEHSTPPFTVEDQLQFILPSRSLAGTPKYVDELYDEGPDSRHTWMKRFAWETDPWVSLPWITLTEVVPLQF